MGTEARGASDAKARRELGWTPERYPQLAARLRRGLRESRVGVRGGRHARTHSSRHRPRVLMRLCKALQSGNAYMDIGIVSHGT